MNNNTEEGFEDKEEALDFLLNELSDRKRKEEWAKTLGGNPNKKAKVIALRKRIFSISAIAASIALVFFLVLGGNNQVPEYQLYASNMINVMEVDYGQATRGSGSAPEDGKEELIKAFLEKDHIKVLQLYISAEFTLSNRDKYNYSLLLAKQDDPDNQLILDLTKDLIDSQNEYTADALLISAAAKIRLNRLEEAKADLIQAKSYKYKTEEITNLLELLTATK